jgi:2-polyprenyl-3-methyl-5-hydroxy-6-metoxy-1,4-benzoquinol methylase
MKHIRNIYEHLGVDNYYRDYGDQYSNPHIAQVQELVSKNAKKLDYSTVLDFCAGGGEVSLILHTLGYEDTNGSDPYTQELYTRNTKKECHTWSFDSVIKEGIKGNYSCIICSFAMHLCPEEKLYPLIIQLFQHSSSLVIITPHKRPQLEKLNGVELDFVDYTLTEKGKKVFLKHYQYVY